MSALEIRAQPFLRPLIRGEASQIDFAGQAALATWAVKTAMVFEALRVEGGVFYTADERKLVRDSARPPSRTSVWLGTYLGGTVAFGHASDLTANLGDHRRFAVHLTTFAFGKVALQISSGHLPEDVPANGVVLSDLEPGPWDQTVERIWPIQADRTVQWPPPVPLADTGETALDLFVDRWGGDET